MEEKNWPPEMAKFEKKNQDFKAKLHSFVRVKLRLFSIQILNFETGQQESQKITENKTIERHFNVFYCFKTNWIINFKWTTEK